MSNNTTNDKQTEKSTKESSPQPKVMQIDLDKTRYILSKPSDIRTQEDLNVFINLTKNIKFFNSFDTDFENKIVLQSCARLMRFEYVPKHQYVFKIDDMGNKFYLLLGGKVSIHIRLPKTVKQRQENPNNSQEGIEPTQVKEDHNQLTRFIDLGPGGAFGEKSLLENKPRAASIFCEENCYFGVLSKKDYLESLKEIEQRKLMKILNWYRSIPGFHTIQNNFLLKQIELNNQEISYNKGQIVYSEGDISGNAFIIKEGEFEAFKSFSNVQISKQDINKNQPQITNYIKENQLKQVKIKKLWTFVEKDMFGEEDEIFQQRRQFTVVCKSLSGGKLIMVPKYNLTRRVLKNEECYQYFKEKAEFKRDNLMQKINNQYESMNKYEDYFWRQKNKFKDKYEEMEKKINNSNNQDLECSIEYDTKINDQIFEGTNLQSSQSISVVQSPLKRKNTKKHTTIIKQSYQSIPSSEDILSSSARKYSSLMKQNVTIQVQNIERSKKPKKSTFLQQSNYTQQSESNQNLEEKPINSLNPNHIQNTQMQSSQSLFSLAEDKPNQLTSRYPNFKMEKSIIQEHLDDQEEPSKENSIFNFQAQQNQQNQERKPQFIRKTVNEIQNEDIQKLRNEKLDQALSQSKKVLCYISSKNGTKLLQQELQKLNNDTIPIIDNTRNKKQLKQDIYNYRVKIQNQLLQGDITPAEKAKLRLMKYKKQQSHTKVTSQNSINNSKEDIQQISRQGSQIFGNDSPLSIRKSKKFSQQFQQFSSRKSSQNNEINIVQDYKGKKKSSFYNPEEEENDNNNKSLNSSLNTSNLEILHLKQLKSDIYEGGEDHYENIVDKIKEIENEFKNDQENTTNNNNSNNNSNSNKKTLKNELKLKPVKNLTLLREKHSSVNSVSSFRSPPSIPSLTKQMNQHFYSNSTMNQFYSLQNSPEKEKNISDSNNDHCQYFQSLKNSNQFRSHASSQYEGINMSITNNNNNSNSNNSNLNKVPLLNNNQNTARKKKKGMIYPSQLSLNPYNLDLKKIKEMGKLQNNIQEPDKHLYTDTRRKLVQQFSNYNIMDSFKNSPNKSTQRYPSPQQYIHIQSQRKPQQQQDTILNISSVGQNIDQQNSYQQYQQNSKQFTAKNILNSDIQDSVINPSTNISNIEDLPSITSPKLTLGSDGLNTSHLNLNILNQHKKDTIYQNITSKIYVKAKSYIDKDQNDSKSNDSNKNKYKFQMYKNNSNQHSFQDPKDYIKMQKDFHQNPRLNKQKSYQLLSEKQWISLNNTPPLIQYNQSSSNSNNQNTNKNGIKSQLQQYHSLGMKSNNIKYGSVSAHVSPPGKNF